MTMLSDYVFGPSVDRILATLPRVKLRPQVGVNYWRVDVTAAIRSALADIREEKKMLTAAFDASPGGRAAEQLLETVCRLRVEEEHHLVALRRFT